MPKFQSNDLNGVMPAMITSFNKDESINKEGLRNIVNHSINEKVNGLYVTGSTGETFLMSPEEKKKVIDIIVEEVNGRVPVIAHIGSIGTKITTDLAEYATKAGVDGLSALPPFYYNFTNEEIFNYYSDIAKSSDLPIIIYNIERANLMDIDTLKKLAAIENIKGVKYTAATHFNFEVIKKEFDIDLNKAKFFAGHSLGEYSAIACAGYLDFRDTIKILKIRGNAMQNSVPKGEGGMTAILGTTIEVVENLLNENQNNFKVEIANDNSEGQIVLSGKIQDLEKLSILLKEKKIKNIRLPVSAPFHCKLMNNATKIMQHEIEKCDFKKPKNTLISNVTSQEVNDIFLLKELLIKQIESRVRWRENVNLMLKKKINNFIEIGPGKVLSGLVKRIDKNVNIISINNEDDINKININD